MWSAMSTSSPGAHNGCIPPHAFETTRVVAPRARITRTGNTISCIE